MTLPEQAVALANELTSALGERCARDVPLARFTTYRLGGPAAVYVEAESLDDLLAVRAAWQRHRLPLLVVGRGSNLLVAEAGFPGLALHLSGRFDGLGVDDTTVRAGAGVALPVLARRCASEGRSGLEFYVGIPGSVGGAVRMNAGGHGRETADVLVQASVLDFEGDRPEVARPAADLAFSYRHSSLSPFEVVLEAEFSVVSDDPGACAGRIDEIVRWRREHQPGGSNAGSVFTNPPGDSAGRLIDACGLKGYRVGGAVVSEKHANFFQAEDGASADDVWRLVFEVQRLVDERAGVHLVPELRMVGFPDRPTPWGGEEGSAP